MTQAEHIPPKALAAAGLLIVFSLVTAAIGSFTGLGKLETPRTEAVRTLELRFDDAKDGGVLVLRTDRSVITKLAPGTNGFTRGVVRSLVRHRRMGRVDADPPFQLVLWADHRLTLTDPATAQTIDLSGFGRDNVQAFARLLDDKATAASLGPS
ncbi:MAG: photosynthetic complex assembly protein PuhC, partial [Myxococcota bacterium]